MRLYILVGALLFLAVLIWRMPVSWVAGSLPAGVQCQQSSGSLWRGRCQTLHTSVADVQGVSWQLAALPLLRGRAQLRLQIDDPLLQAGATLQLRLSGAWQAESLIARLPVDSPLLRMAPRGYRGDLVADLTTVAGDGTAINSAAGTVQLLRLRSTAELGSYEVRFTPATHAGEINGAVRDLEGPLQVQGTLRIHPHAYDLHGLAMPRGAASDELNNAMAMLGPPDEQGRRQISLEGTF